MEASVFQLLSKRLLTIAGIGSILKPVFPGLSVKYCSQGWEALGKECVQLVFLRSVRR